MSKPVALRTPSSAAWVATGLVSLAAILVFVSCRKQPPSNDDDNDSSSCHDSSTDASTRLRTALKPHQRQEQPLYIQRRRIAPDDSDVDARKQERRNRMRKIMAMKKPMYDNIIMQDPRGEILSTVSQKKARWYIRKGLAQYDDNDETEDTGKVVLRLNFEPCPERKNNHQKLIRYNQSIKENRCVACGSEEDYRRHYVVPYVYRTQFPPRFKTHLPHDVVILCPDCHMVAQNATQRRMNLLEKRLRLQQQEKLKKENQDGCPSSTSHIPFFFDNAKSNVKSAASALLKWQNRLPQEKIVEYQEIVCDHYRLPDATRLNQALLEQASYLDPRIANPDFISGDNLVAQELWGRENDKAKVDQIIGEFVKEWRFLFQSTLQPQYLPNGWSIDAPVKSDYRQVAAKD